MSRFHETATFAGGAHSLTTGVGSVETDPLTDGTTVVFLFCDQNAHVKIGQDPTATTSDFLLPASNFLALRVNPGDKVAAIQETAAGTLWVSEGIGNPTI